MKVVVNIEIELDIRSLSSLEEQLEGLFKKNKSRPKPRVFVQAPVQAEPEPEVELELEPLPEPEPEPVKPKRKRRTTAKKRKPKAKPAGRKPVQTPVEPEISDQEMLAAENEFLPYANDLEPPEEALEPEPDNKETADKILAESATVVELPVERTEEPKDSNAIFSALVTRSAELAIQLLKKHNLTRFSDAKGETLVAMMEDAQDQLRKFN